MALVISVTILCKSMDEMFKHGYWNSEVIYDDFDDTKIINVITLEKGLIELLKKSEAGTITLEDSLEAQVKAAEEVRFGDG
jgi:hypothetical protein